MKLEEYYSVSELLQLNEESAKNEFKPKFGNGAKRSSNDKDVKDVIKNANSLNKGVGEKEQPKKPKVEFTDYNKTTLDVNFEYEPDDSWKSRVKAQVHGYPSEQNEKENDYAESLGFDGNKKFYDDRKEMSNDRNELDTQERESGLKARVKDKTDYSNKDSFKESKQIKRLKFKNTIFLSEKHLLSKVPDDYRFDENKFYMQDQTGTDYLVECKADPFGYIHMDVTNKFNKSSINEELEKMRRLADYSYKDDNVKIDKNTISDMSESISDFREKLLNK